MPLEFKLDAEGCLKQFDELLTALANLELDLPNTFLNWQRDDMHRKFPKVEGSGLSYSTTIYPRSRLRRTKNLTGGKSVRRRSIIAAGRPGGAHKPILRPELFEKLKERMVEMLVEPNRWQ